MPGTGVPQSVTFLYGGMSLGAGLLALFGEERHVNAISSPVELAQGPPSDVVVVDVPAQDRPAAYEAVRRHYHGPVIVLLGRGESRHDLPPDNNRTLLTRPFSIRELSAALAASAPTQPTWDPAGRSPAAQAAPRRPRSWRERRLVRVSAITVAAAALLFMGAFAVVSHGDRCGPGCDKLTSADLAAPSSTIVPVRAVQAGPETTDGRVDPTTNDPGVGPTADGESAVDAASRGTTPISSTSASLRGAPSPSSAPDPIRPQPPAAPTIAPTTTRPKTSTSTSTSTTTTTATTATTTTRP